MCHCFIKGMGTLKMEQKGVPVPVLLQELDTDKVSQVKEYLKFVDIFSESRAPVLCLNEQRLYIALGWRGT